MLGARFGHFLDKPLTPLAQAISLHPNLLTVAGFLITAAAAGVIPFHKVLGGVLILLGGFCDILDGMVARVKGKASKFGAFLDSFLDRVADALLFISVSWHLAASGDHTGAFLSIGTMVSAYLVSYARARAEGLGMQCKVGLMERPERIILLTFGLITGWLRPVLWVLFVFTSLTVVQRVMAVWKRDREEKRGTKGPGQRTS